MPISKPIGDPNILSRRLVSNPRYDEVAPTVDCGVNVNVLREIKQSEVPTKQLAGELFRRLRPSTIANQLEAVTREQQHQRGDACEGGEELAEYVVPRAPKRSLLLLDVREKEEYEQCHIFGALHYPATMLSRSMNQFTPDILAFKNKENHLIVLYDLEEEIVIGRKAANIMFEKGIDNIAIIAGGMREFVQDYACWVVGDSPVLPTRSRLRLVRDGLAALCRKTGGRLRWPHRLRLPISPRVLQVA